MNKSKTPSLDQMRLELMNKGGLSNQERRANRKKFMEPSKDKRRFYHGSKEPNIVEFKTRKQIADENYPDDPSNDYRDERNAIFLSPDPKFTRHFSVEGYTDTGQAPTTYPVHVQARNPFDFDKPKHRENLWKTYHDIYYNPESDLYAHGPHDTASEKTLAETRMKKRIHESHKDENNWPLFENPNVQQAIQDMGHDSFYIRERGTKNLGVYDPRKIKSAIGNRGTYDTTNPDINKAKGGGIDYTERERKRLKLGEILPHKERQKNLRKMLESSQIKDRLYHATPSDIRDFKPGGLDPRVSGHAMWFSNDPTRTPAAHHIGSYDNPKTGVNVMPVHVQAKNPLVIDDEGMLGWARDVYGEGSAEFPYLMPKKWRDKVVEDYDSIILADPHKRGDSHEIIMFHPEKIKSAIGNRGTYDTNVADINKAKGGSVPSEPGSTPIKEGHVRLYHQTDGDNLREIEKHGLLLKHAKGIEGPRAIYAGETPFYGDATKKPTLEFQVPKEHWDAPFVLRDVHPQDFISAHYPWHRHARYLEDESGIKNVLSGKFDTLKGDEGKAVEYIKNKYSTKKAKGGEVHMSEGDKPNDAAFIGYLSPHGKFESYPESVAKANDYHHSYTIKDLDAYNAEGGLTFVRMNSDPEITIKGTPAMDPFHHKNSPMVSDLARRIIKSGGHHDMPIKVEHMGFEKHEAPYQGKYIGTLRQWSMRNAEKKAKGGNVMPKYPSIEEMLQKLQESGRTPIMPAPDRWFKKPEQHPFQQKAIEKLLAYTGHNREAFPHGAHINPLTGEPLDFEIMHDLGVAIDPMTGTPRMSGIKSGLTEIDPKLGSLTKSNLIRKGLFKHEGGDPLLDRIKFLATIEKSGKGHHYGLSTHYESPAELVQEMRGNPTLRPHSRGDIYGVGDEVGRISIKGMHHPVFEKLVVAPSGMNVQGKKLHKAKGGVTHAHHLEIEERPL